MFESYVFFPVDSEKDQEEWPLMELTDATVITSKRNGPTELVDLLDVQDRGPFRIEGTLTPIADELGNIIRTKNATRLYSEPLVITQVMMYSIQQFEDGDVKIWALGKCGWYSIIPSPKYEPIFRTMVEKGKLWVFLQDKYCEKYSGKGSRIRGTVEDLYASYVKLEPGLLSTAAASRLFENHYRYLLFEMCGVRADTDMWARTPLFRHFALKHAAELKAIQRSMACTSDRSNGSTSTPKGASPQPPSPSVCSPPPPPSKRPRVHNRSNSYTLFKLFSEHVEERSLSPCEITRDLMIQFTNDNFVFESYQGAAANIDARAEDFLSLMEYPPPVMAYDWTETPAYKQLGSVRTSETDSAVRLRKLVPRTPEPADDEDEMEEGASVGTSIFIRSPVKPPTLAKGKSPARVPVRLQVASSSKTIDDNDPEDALEDTPAVLALNQKRVLDDLFSPHSGVPSAKRPRTTAVAGLSTDSSTLSALSSTTTNSGLPPGTDRVPCTATDPQATRTNRPGDHWECEISGCSHTVLDADTAESLQLIEKHYAEHAKVIKKAMDAIDGAKVLPSRPHHVNNLLAKIEQMARKWAVSNPTPLSPLELGLPGSASAPAVSGAE